MRGIAHGNDRRARFLDRLHVRDEQILCADIQEALDQDQIVPGRPHDRRGRAPHQCLQLAQHHRQFVGRVLGVDENPIKARPGDHLGREVAAGVAPQTNLRTPFAEGFLERIHRQFHSGRLSTQRREARVAATARGSGTVPLHWRTV